LVKAEVCTYRTAALYRTAGRMEWLGGGVFFWLVFILFLHVGVEKLGF